MGDRILVQHVIAGGDRLVLAAVVGVKACSARVYLLHFFIFFIFLSVCMYMCVFACLCVYTSEIRGD